MRLPGLKLLRSLSRPLVSTLRPGGLILGYHQVAHMPWDPLNLCVSPECFCDHLEALSASFELVSVGRLVGSLGRSERVAGMAALTFDDGYGGFVEHVLPQLEDRAVPATIFVSPGFIGRPYWWDEVAAAFEPRLQADSPLTLGCGGVLPWRGVKEPVAAAKLVRDVCRELERLSSIERDAIVERCRQHLAEHDGSQPPLGLTLDQLGRLAKHPLIEIGAHGVAHLRLDELDRDRQRREIADSRRQLEKVVGGGFVRGMSYPHGAFTQETPSFVAEAGYDYACASHPGLVRPTSDRYQLPRVWAPNVDAARFRQWLRPWLGWR